jgi:hypothetical protein
VEGAGKAAGKACGEPGFKERGRQRGKACWEAGFKERGRAQRMVWVGAAANAEVTVLGVRGEGIAARWLRVFLRNPCGRGLETPTGPAASFRREFFRSRERAEPRTIGVSGTEERRLCHNLRGRRKLACLRGAFEEESRLGACCVIPDRRRHGAGSRGRY